MCPSKGHQHGISIQTGFSIRACSRWNSLAISHELAALFSLEITTPRQTKKQQNLMMSIFCSNTLIFAPECWKCTLRGPDFKIFPGAHAPGRILPRNLRFQFNACKSQGTFFPVLCLLQSFCHLFKILSKTL